jgi:transcriptional regulator with XRE-family HTH domain
MPRPSRLGRNLRRIRQMRDMTQQAVCDEVRRQTGRGMSRTVIAELEAGSRQSVNLDTCIRIARALQTDLNTLVGYSLFEDTDDVESEGAAASV